VGSSGNGVVSEGEVLLTFCTTVVGADVGVELLNELLDVLLLLDGVDVASKLLGVLSTTWSVVGAKGATSTTEEVGMDVLDASGMDCSVVGTDVLDWLGTNGSLVGWGDVSGLVLEAEVGLLDVLDSASVVAPLAVDSLGITWTVVGCDVVDEVGSALLVLPFSVLEMTGSVRVGAEVVSTVVSSVETWSTHSVE